MYEDNFPKKRYRHSLSFLKKFAPAPLSLLDLGVENPFSKIMESEGYAVENTAGEDLDLHPEVVGNHSVDMITAFEIFEHLLSPFQVLKEIKAEKLIASVPLRLWFSTAYRSKTDPWDRHFHEFEAWQFDWLLEKTGWKIIATEKFANPVGKIGIRPLLREFTPRYYMVYAERKSSENMD